MIDIKDKSECCGCTACVSVCGHRAITMRADGEGFFYPKVDPHSCTGCGICETVCPVPGKTEGKTQGRTPLQAFAAKNPDEAVRRVSSSGGIFTLLAEQVTGKGGVVFGAKYDGNLDAVHGWTETAEGLAAFRGSKYAESRMNDCFTAVRRFLKASRQVLFSGTPCQAAGLRKFLGKDWPNLLTVDLICHGVPSPQAFRAWMEEEGRRSGTEIAGLAFREKWHGWKKPDLTLTFADGKQATAPSYENEYMRAFLSNLILRPSCYACPVKEGRSGSDLTIGDFWGIETVLPEFDDDRGVSVVLANTRKGMEALSASGAVLVRVNFQEALRGNPSYFHSVKEPHCQRELFFRRLEKDGFHRAFTRATSTKLQHRILRRLYCASAAVRRQANGRSNGRTIAGTAG